MARKVFFSFHYQNDLWRVNVVRNSGLVDGISAAGFHDQSIWEETRKKGDEAVKKYEIERSVARGNGILGIRINHIKGIDGLADPPGLIPEALTRVGAPVYTYEYGKLGDWVERAYKEANPGT